MAPLSRKRSLNDGMGEPGQTSGPMSTERLVFESVMRNEVCIETCLLMEKC